MFSLEQQEQTTEIVTGLQSLNHPIEQVFTSAKEFLTPTQEIIELYTECYQTYSQSTLYNILEYTNSLLSIRSKITENMQSLGFDFDLNELYQGLNNFCTFLEGLVSMIGRYAEYDERQNKMIPIILSVQQIQEFSDNYLSNIELEQTKTKLLTEINGLIAELRTHVGKRDSQIDIHQIIHVINTLFSSCGLIDSENGKIASIKTAPYFSTPHISDHQHFSIQVGNISQSLDINRKLHILFQIVKFLWNKEYFWERVDMLGPTPEMREELKKDIQNYGAKGAYLRLLKNFLSTQERIIESHYNKGLVTNILTVKTMLEREENINEENAKKIAEEMRKKLDTERIGGFDFELLPSLEIDIELYMSWKNGENIDWELEAIYTKAHTELFQEPKPSKNSVSRSFGRGEGLLTEAHGLIVRSSAVYSEDSEKTSGAGIYETVGGIYSLEDFIRAVKVVYQSVESDKAKAHRKEYSIPEEYMGLVIMPYMDTGSEYMGYVNTSRVGKSHLMDIKDMNGKQATLQKDILPVDFQHELHFGNYISQMYNIDIWNKELGFRISDIGLARILPLMFFMEQCFNRSMQFEFISESSNRDDRVFIVQMRPLNYNETPVDIPEFPNQEYIYEGKSIIPGDIVVDVENILIKRNSWQATMKRNLEYSLEENYKAVIITDGFSVNAGHIETLCSEKGIICICDDPSRESMELNLERYTQVRIVSDGEIARIYPIS